MTMAPSYTLDPEVNEAFERVVQRFKKDYDMSMNETHELALQWATANQDDMADWIEEGLNS